jgi:hypothetical protein
MHSTNSRTLVLFSDPLFPNSLLISDKKPNAHQSDLENMHFEDFQKQQLSIIRIDSSDSAQAERKGSSADLNFKIKIRNLKYIVYIGNSETSA